ncbi:dihydroorotate dehydrogenase [Ructibacterium gallinarum]|uniref:Dihydroorotate dehydrogenase n=1 Tax=Ructibacterium gallinarum TaxID=2779355 RepID=A0A9D5LZL7_9FIRM|nr:dihydroorotate dehydrogenase [Ructibacterium gallinarum]MBE5040981.1 dihydroorotate dehydrogenase [Ructibacterium gallinarum]
MAEMRVNIAGVEWKNPVTTGSGTFGFGREYSDFFDLSELGAICLKALSVKPRQGNPSPRIAETPKGILNSVGLQNPGAEAFLSTELPWLRQFDTKLIANLAGSTIEDYVQVAEMLGDSVDMFELNISCPNVKEGGMAFGTDAKMIENVTSQVKQVSKVPLIVKLSPNVTDIAEMARAAEAGGADAVSLINTLFGMRIDVKTRRPVLRNNMGGLSGPAVKPVAVRMVYQVRQAVKIPIIGMGGITTGEDAVEFMLAGANAVAVGTAGIVDPYAWIRVRNGIEQYLNENNIADVNEIVGAVQMND